MSKSIESGNAAQQVHMLTSKNPEAPWKRRFTHMGIVAAVVFFISLWLPARYHIEAQGIVLPSENAWIGSSTGGIVDKVLVKPGQWVEPGQPLIRLKNKELMAQLHIAQAEAFLAQFIMHGSYTSHMADSQAYAGTAAQRMESALIHYEAMVNKAQELVLRSPIEGQVVSPYLSRLAGSFAPPHTELLQIADTRDLIILIPVAEEDANKIEAGNSVKARWVSTGKVFHTQLESTPVRKAKLDDYFQAIYATFGGPAPQQMQISALQPQKAQAEDPEAQLYPIFIAEARVPSEAWIRIQPQMRVRLTIEGKSTTIGYQLWGWLEGLLRK